MALFEKQSFMPDTVKGLQNVNCTSKGFTEASKKGLPTLTNESKMTASGQLSAESILVIRKKIQN